MESTKQNLASNPRDSANFLSILTFWWTVDIFRKGYNKILDITDIFGPTKKDQSKLLVDRLERQWKKQLKTPKPSLLKATFLAFKWECIFVGLLNLIPQLLKSVMYPLLIGQLLRYFRKNPDASYDETIYVTAVLLGVILFVTIFGNKMYVDGFHFGMKMRVSVCGLIYRKSLKLSRTALGDTAPGKIVNLLSNDVSRFDISSIFLHTVWVGPFVALFILYFLWIEARWAGMIGSLFVLIVVPVQSYTGKLSSKYRLDIALRTDERVRFMDEIITGALVIKMYAWEKPFSKLIQLARKLELNVVRKNGYLRGVYMTFIMFTNRMAMFATMVTLVIMNEQLTAAKVFSILAFYNALSKQLAHLFVRAFAEVVEVLVVFKRLQKFLLYSEKKSKLSIPEHINGFHELSEKEKLIESNTQLPNDVAICINDGTARWNLKESNSKQNEKINLASAALDNINIEFKKGILIGVIGPIGSGKSSLLQTILGELPFESGSIIVDGTLSYASQDPWVFAGSVKQNIIFGQKMNQLRYEKVIKACALLTDFDQFPYGDNSLVGDRGAALSGGQKARINLARSIYRQADIYLLDDPLSAVDAHVGHHLFESVIGPKGFLSKTQSTRILVTHQVHFLKKADWIIVLKDGKVEFQGTPTDLTHSNTSGTHLFTIDNSEEGRSRLNSKISNRSSRNSLNDEFDNIVVEDDNEILEENSKMLRNVEESSHDKMKGSILFQYLRIAASPFRLFLIISLYFITQVAGCLADWWVSFWTGQEELRLYFNQTHTIDNNDSLLSTNTCMSIYTIFIAGLLIIGITRAFEHFNCSMAASQNLHDDMFKGIVSSPIRFFDINPAGRILNRFSKDIGAIDELLPKTMLDSVQLLFILVGLFVVIAIVNPILLIPLGGLGIAFMFIRKVFLKTSNNIKRIEAITRSPVFSHLVSTLNGLSTIRAFEAQDILVQEFDSHQDLHSGAWFMYITTTSAFGFALELICLIFIAVILISFLVFDITILGDKVGLIITQALIIPETMQWCARQSAEVSNYMMSVERLLEYRDLPGEKQPIIQAQLPPQWPSQGKIEFRNVIYRYFNESEAVLKELCFVISPGEKIGIVGRTGAGKSSLIGALFRIAVIEGEILIDNIETSSVLLQTLRSKISIIPQDPILFSGTLRRNLDPFEEFEDNQLWKVLEEIELKYLVTNGGLESPVLTGGSNFSVGQRQLLCLARAILRNNKILVLDEATANVDPETDTLIQRTIREKFADCTVLTIAHRLHTIMDSDRILVMNLGSVEEFERPYELLQKEHGILKEMVEATGQQESQRLKNISYVKYKEQNLNKKL